MIFWAIFEIQWQICKDLKPLPSLECAVIEGVSFWVFSMFVGSVKTLPRSKPECAALGHSFPLYQHSLLYILSFLLEMVRL